jgi:ATP-binding cassette subfamily B multidrug efflux pump
LLAAGGLYARLWAHQSGGFLGEEADAADESTPAAQAPAGQGGSAPAAPN